MKKIIEITSADCCWGNNWEKTTKTSVWTLVMRKEDVLLFHKAGTLPYVDDFIYDLICDDDIANRIGDYEPIPVHREYSAYSDAYNLYDASGKFLLHASMYDKVERKPFKFTYAQLRSLAEYSRTGGEEEEA